MIVSAPMLRELRGLVRESAIYGLSTVLGRTLNFLLTPLFTHLLDRSESGVVQTVYAYIAWIMVVYGLGLDVAYLRLGRREGRSDPGAFTAALAAVAAAAIALSLVLHALAEPIASAIGVPVELAIVIKYAAWILAVDALCQIPYAELRGAHMPGTYVGVKLAGILMTLPLTWYLVARMGLGVRGVFLANLLASCATLGMLAPVALSRLAAPDWKAARSMLAFGLPLVAALLGSMAVGVSDRPIMTKLGMLDAAGLYGNCHKLGIFMSLLVAAFDQAWKPFVLERADRPDVDLLIARVLSYFAAIGGWALLAIALLVPDLVRFPLFGGRPLYHEAYWDGLAVVPVVALGYLFNGLYFVMLGPLMIERRTGAVSAATWAGAVISIGANLALIPRLGIMGAAWAACAAYAAMALAVWALGRRRGTPYEWGRLLLLAAWTGALWALGARAGFAARLLLVAAYPVGLRLSGFLDAQELAELKALFSARSSRREPGSPPA